MFHFIMIELGMSNSIYDKIDSRIRSVEDISSNLNETTKGVFVSRCSITTVFDSYNVLYFFGVGCVILAGYFSVHLNFSVIYLYFCISLAG